MLENFVSNMSQLSLELSKKGLGNLHLKNICVNSGRLCIGELLFISDTV